MIAWLPMARMPLEEAEELTAADVVHRRFSALPADATIGEVRSWFDESSHRRIAVFVEDGRYAGTLIRGDLDGELDPSRLATELATPRATVAPEMPAHTAHELATNTPAHRVPVVDHDGALIGVVGVTDDLAGFCGPQVGPK